MIENIINFDSEKFLICFCYNISIFEVNVKLNIITFIKDTQRNKEILQGMK